MTSHLFFYDTHCHALTLSHPSLLSFTQTLRHRGLEEMYAQITSPNYLITALFFKTGERVRNMLAVMEREVGSIFQLMEDDLSGKYSSDDTSPPLLEGGSLRLRGQSFDRLVLCPLIMDFQCAVYDSADKSYYDMSGTKLVESQIRDVLMGIRAYRRERPDGFLEIRPFLGVDVRHYTLDELAAFLEATFEGYERGETASIAAFAAMKDHNPDSPVPGRFAGIKVYPPLGFDPLPGEGTERDKTELLWSFCEARDVPIVTHCDDQGFRIVGLEEAWRNTSPARWEPVLRSHPKLRLDFAHFGAQYSHPLGRPLSTEWTDRIVRLMVDFPNVYADFSFDGSEPEYYRWLEGYLAKCSRGLASQIEDRLLFGSDFMVNLVKIRSYAEYYRLFAGSPLSDELIRRFGHDNPERFLFA